MKKLTTLILAVAVFGLLAFIILAGPPAPTAPLLPAVFLDFQRSEVRTVDLKTARGEFHLERDAADRDRWRILSGKTLVRADATKVEAFLDDLSRLRPKNLWTAREVRPGERTTWGLDAPSMTVRLGLPSGTLRADFGRRTPDSNNVYAEKDANGDVLVVPVAGLADAENHEVRDLRESRPVGGSSMDVASLSLRRGDDLLVEARRAGSTWEVDAPWRGAAEPRAMEELLTPLLNVQVAEFVADGNPDLDRYGLLKPRAVVTLRRQGREKPQTIRFGGEAPGGRVHFTEDGEPSVYACEGKVLEDLLEFDPATLRDRNALRLGWTRLDSLEYAAGEGSWKLLRILERWDLEKPERVEADGKAVEELLGALRELEVLRFLDGEDPATLGVADPGKAAARLVLEGTDDGGDRHLLIGPRDAEGNAPARLLPKGGEKDAGAPFLLPAAFLDRLEAGRRSLRTAEIWHLHQEEIRALTRTWNGRTETFLYEKKSWKADEGGPEPDAAALDRLLATVLRLEATGWVGPAKDAPAAWGLGDPPAGPVLTFRLEEGGKMRERSLVLGTPVEEGGAHYGRVSDGNEVFRLPDQLLEGADLKPLWGLLTGPLAKEKPGEPAKEPAKEGE